jgi:2-iminobutanoate/2-iminopropanoate deaminase
MKTVISTTEAPAAIGPYSQGIGLENVVKTTVFMTDLAKFDEMNIVYGRYFTGQPPARSTIQVAALPKGANVEIEAIAVKPS